MKNRDTALLTLVILTFIQIEALQAAKTQLTPSEYDTLADMTDAPVWSLDGKSYLCKVQKAYDGDSLKCIIRYA